MVTRAVLPDLRQRAGEPATILSPHPAHLGRVRVRPGRAPRRSPPRARRARRRHARVPRLAGSRGSGSASPPRAPTPGRSRPTIAAEEVDAAGHARRPGVRRRRRDHGAQRRRHDPPSRAQPRAGRVGDRWADRVADRRRSPAPAGGSAGRSCRTPPRSSSTCSTWPRAPWSASRPPPRWPAGPDGCSAPTIGLAVTGVAGPDEQDGQPVGHGVLRLRHRRRGRGAPGPAPGRPGTSPPVRLHLGARRPAPPVARPRLTDP